MVAIGACRCLRVITWRTDPCLWALRWSWDLFRFGTEYFSVLEHLAIGPGLGLHLLLASCCARHYWECSEQLRLVPSLLSSPWLWHGCCHRFQEEQETVSHPVPAASTRVASTSPCGECELEQTHTLTPCPVAMTSGCCWGRRLKSTVRTLSWESRKSPAFLPNQYTSIFHFFFSPESVAE